MAGLVTTVIQSNGECRCYFPISAPTAVGSTDMCDEVTGASDTTVVCFINSQFIAMPNFSWKFVIPWLDLLEILLCLPLSLACKPVNIQCISKCPLNTLRAVCSFVGITHSIFLLALGKKWKRKNSSFFFFALLWHVGVPAPMTESVPQQWQHWVLNPLSHQGTPLGFLKSYTS